MAQLRQVFYRQTAVTAGANGTTLVDLVGPETALADPFAEGTDHVVRDRQVRQNESGWFSLSGWDSSALDASALTIDVEVWSRASSAAQKGLEAPLFPSGAAAVADPVLKRVVVSGMAGNDDDLLEIYGGASLLPEDQNVPQIHLRADEFVRLRIVNSSSALGPVTLIAKYDLGLNPADNMRRA